MTPSRGIESLIQERKTVKEIKRLSITKNYQSPKSVIIVKDKKSNYCEERQRRGNLKRCVVHYN